MVAYLSKADQAAAARRHYEANAAKVKARAVAWKQRQRRRLLVMAWEAKSVPCADCAKTFPPVAMDFDHAGSPKDAAIANLIHGACSVDRLMAEIVKCDVVCANCHRLRTWERGERFGLLEALPSESEIPTLFG